jgi:hypothetical protein
MLPDWQTMAAVTNGTAFIRSQSATYLPQEPREDDDAYRTRVNRSVLSPYTLRLIENAAGLVLRRPITVDGSRYWQDFASNVDGLGSSINEYARQILVSALTYGHSGILVDYPAVSGARTLAEELAEGRRPYFVTYDAPQIYGWRQAGTLPSAPLTQIRLHEWAVIPKGEFSEETEEHIRVIYPGRYEVYNREGVVTSGAFSLNKIPFIPIYTNRTGMLTSTPPLLDIANLNITHYQRQADLIHALHIAAMPILVLEGWDDTDSAGVGVNYALAMQPGNKAYYVNADSTSFGAQTTEIDNLASQMSSLGVTKLLGQKFVAESADAKRIDQAQANSVMAITSMELESALQQAFDVAAEYVGRPAPKIHLDRDFDFYRLLGQDIAVIGDLNERGAITDKTFLQILKSGEILPDTINIDKELQETEELRQKRKEEALGTLDSGPMGSPQAENEPGTSRGARRRRAARETPPPDTETRSNGGTN